MWLLPSETWMFFADNHGSAIASWTMTHVSAKAAPTRAYVIIFAVIRAHRDGVASTVGVIVS